MILCCAVPLTLIIILSLTGTLGSWGFFALMLLCPIMHVLMMRGHTSSHNDIKGLLPSPEVTKDKNGSLKNQH
jgi:O-antigen ligase